MMSTTFKLVAVGFVAALIMGGGRPVMPATEAPGAATEAADAAATKASAGGDPTPITGDDTMASDAPASDPATAAAIDELSVRLGVSPDQITVVSVEAVVWPDASLGCPQPGMMYAQVLQDGMRIVLSVDGVEYAYHSGETQAPFLCENPAGGG